MGNILSQAPLEKPLIGSGPIIRTSWTDSVSTPGLSYDTECEGFELRFYDCLNAVGGIRAQEYCKLYFQDFKECTHKYKQLSRVQAMRQERWKQYWKGVAGLGEKKPMYTAQVPEFDSYAAEPDYSFDYY